MAQEMSEKLYGGLTLAECIRFAARDYPGVAAIVRDLLAEIERLEEQQRHAICKECGEPLTPPKRAPLIQRVERPKLRDDIESPILRYILYLEAMLAAIEEQSAEEERAAIERFCRVAK